VPRGEPEAVLISGYGADPIPSTSLLAYRCLSTVAKVDDLLWIAALGMIGDYGEKAPFPELAEARGRYKPKALREATSLINAPRRTAAGDARAALDLVLRAGAPEEVVADEGGALQAARDEVKGELDAARKIAPRFAGPVALIELDSPCQIHPLIAQSWTGRLRRQIVIAANRGFRPGFVHFAARTASGQNLVAFLRERAPPGAAADSAYGGGHEGASGGALSLDDWATFKRGLGFDD
jgi:single-stranded-DNA-specific exonuclease